MLPFGFTIPATVPPRSEILEGLKNYPVDTHTHTHLKFFQNCPNHKFSFLKQEANLKRFVSDELKRPK
jgi:hypothetical protein